MLVIFALAVAMFGLLIGSFLNVVAIRTLKRESIAFPPSHCVMCNHRLGALDLIPVISYLGLRGKCRYCKERISPIYPIGEFLTAVLYGILAWRIEFSDELIPALVFASILVLIIITDVREMLIPNRIVYAGIIILAAARIFIHPLPLLNYGLAFIVGGGTLLVISWIGSFLLRKESMGGGDIKLLAMAGLVLGIKLTLLTIFAASLLGSLFGLMLIIRGRYQRERYIPFGPFIAAGSMLAYMWGNEIIQWYMELVA